MDATWNPVSVAVLLEATILLALFALLLNRWGMARLGWG